MAQMRINFHGGRGIRKLMAGPEAQALVNDLAKQTADAANAESTWGGYDHADASDNDRARARVWSYDDRNDEARDNRMIRNLP